jgi:hypothetical protein
MDFLVETVFSHPHIYKAIDKHMGWLMDRKKKVETDIKSTNRQHQASSMSYDAIGPLKWIPPVDRAARRYTKFDDSEARLEKLNKRKDNLDQLMKNRRKSVTVMWDLPKNAKVKLGRHGHIYHTRPSKYRIDRQVTHPADVMNLKDLTKKAKELGVEKGSIDHITKDRRGINKRDRMAIAVKFQDMKNKRQI